MTPPVIQTVNFVFGEIYSVFTWLDGIQFRGVSVIAYFIGLAVLGISLDYIFR